MAGGEHRSRGSQAQSIWIAFARTGRPEHSRLPPWPIYQREDYMTMRFDSVICPLSDLTGLAWRQPWTR